MLKPTPSLQVIFFHHSLFHAAYFHYAGRLLFAAKFAARRAVGRILKSPLSRTRRKLLCKIFYARFYAKSPRRASDTLWIDDDFAAGGQARPTEAAHHASNMRFAAATYRPSAFFARHHDPAVCRIKNNVFTNLLQKSLSNLWDPDS